MEQITDGRGQPNNGSLRVEDLMFLDDLRALGVPWVDRLIDPCTSHEDVERVWVLIRMWGPDHEDAKDMLRLSAQLPHLEQEAEKMLRIIRLCKSYRR